MINEEALIYDDSGKIVSIINQDHIDPAKYNNIVVISTMKNREDIRNNPKDYKVSKGKISKKTA